MCLSKYVKVCFIGTIITIISDVSLLVTRNYPTVCTFSLHFTLWVSDFPAVSLNHLRFYAPRKNSGEHIVAALSVRPSVSQSVRPSVRPEFVSGP